MRQLLSPPNLLSLTRIALLWPAGYFMMGQRPEDTYWCMAVVFVAGITDGLDGYLARRLRQVSRLGIALDPIADKIFIGGLAVFAIMYRDFPIWLAALVIGRDLAIMGAAGLLMRGTRISLSSNITGKYTFGALITLMFSHIIRYDFGIATATVATLVLLTASTILYGRIMIKLKKGIPLTAPRDPVWLKRTRVIGSLIYVLVYVTIWFYQNTGFLSP